MAKKGARLSEEWEREGVERTVTEGGRRERWKRRREEERES